MSSRSHHARAAVCLHCGGSLRAAAGGDLFRCDYCDTLHLDDPGEARAFVPVQRLSRRQVLRRLSEHLHRRGNRGHAVKRLERKWLPFWQINGTLAGWQRYLPAVEDTGNRPDATFEIPAELVDEVVTRRVTASIPACDLRGWGLLGIAHVVERLELRPLRERLRETETVFAVGVSRRAADRRVLLARQTTLRPRGARRLRQHFRLMRPSRSLVYYPVWTAVFTIHGEEAEALLDGVEGRILRGTLPARRDRAAARWWFATAGCAWLAGLHPALGIFTGAAWLVRRMGAHPVDDWRRQVPGWLSDELRGIRCGVDAFENEEDA